MRATLADLGAMRHSLTIPTTMPTDDAETQERGKSLPTLFIHAVIALFSLLLRGRAPYPMRLMTEMARSASLANSIAMSAYIADSRCTADENRTAEHYIRARSSSASDRSTVSPTATREREKDPTPSSGGEPASNRLSR
ncbi:MAG: hypothetical protein EON54_10550 [Alcaligenaceae bacterium]|nr:MAG: hypothetical protein EON54_10550 [Alcaligenaceae bacterium]